MPGGFRRVRKRSAWRLTHGVAGGRLHLFADGGHLGNQPNGVLDSLMEGNACPVFRVETYSFADGFACLRGLSLLRLARPSPMIKRNLLIYYGLDCRAGGSPMIGRVAYKAYWASRVLSFSTTTELRLEWGVVACCVFALAERMRTARIVNPLSYRQAHIGMNPIRDNLAMWLLVGCCRNVTTLRGQGEPQNESS